METALATWFICHEGAFWIIDVAAGVAVGLSFLVSSGRDNQRAMIKHLKKSVHDCDKLGNHFAIANDCPAASAEHALPCFFVG